jgi:hypothetical protein
MWLCAKCVKCTKGNDENLDLPLVVWFTPSALRASSRASSSGKVMSSISSSGCPLHAHNNKFSDTLLRNQCVHMHACNIISVETAHCSDRPLFRFTRTPHAAFAPDAVLHRDIQSTANGETTAPNLYQDKSRTVPLCVVEPPNAPLHSTLRWIS